MEALIAEAQKVGWASAKGSLAQIRSDARMLGLTEVPVRRGGPPVTTLRPLSRAEAPANSLSAQYGTGVQPLHTDGAHLPQPPDLVFLVCERASVTHTLLWRPRRIEHQTVVTEPECARHGIFLVHSGGDSFFSPAYANARFRYDPGCMTPCDARARETVRHFEAAAKRATEHRWEHADTVLIIDNRRTLHARASAANEPQREIQRVAYRLKGAV